MKTLTSAAVFGLVATPPAEAPESSLGKPRSKCEFPRMLCACLTRLATPEELASIRKELEAIDAKVRNLRRSLLRSPRVDSCSGTPQRGRSGTRRLDA